MQMKFREHLTIGCSSKCGRFYRRALKEAAKHQDVSLEIVELDQEDRIHWEKLDGLLLPGGPDINPCYYYSSIEKDLRDHSKSLVEMKGPGRRSRQRDAFEHGLLMEYFHNKALRDLPVLGICRGMQMLAVSQGIPLYVDLKTELGIRAPSPGLDKVEVVRPDSLMNHLAKRKQFVAPKLHHQAIRSDYFYDHYERWPNVEITAFSHEGKMAEAIEFRDRPVLGVQFHAELGLNEEMKNIFRWFLRSACQRHRHLEDFEYRYAS